MKPAALLLAVLTIAQAPTVDAVLAKLDGYLAGYEPQLSELIADETMRQEVPTDAVPSEGNFRRRRQLTSEVAFIALPQEAGWLGFRHVKKVNNIPVALGDESLSASLKLQSLDAARELLKDSAAHNLGLPRTTNLPNLPLEFLHQRNRKRLVARADGQESVRGRRATRLVLLERMTPTLITNPDSGADMPSVIRAWIDPRSGELLRAEVATFQYLNAKRHTSSVRVEFTPNDVLGMLVPSEMREEFPVLQSGKGTGVARYSNFRRFTTSGRIVPQ